MSRLGAVRVVGLDVSLASTGIARLTVGPDGPAGSYSTCVGRSLEDTATLEQRAARLDWARGAVLDEVVPNRVDVGWTSAGAPHLVVVEGPAFAAHQPGADELSALRWLIFIELYGLGVPIAVCSPSTLKVYAAGHGGSKKTPVTKAHVVEAARRHYRGLFDLAAGPGLADRADSAVLAAMGARHLGRPVDELPTTHVRALKSVRWPSGPNREDQQ